MKRFAQQFKKQSEKTKLSAEEQFILREKITTFMEYHPLPASGAKRSETLSLSDPFVVVRLPWRKWRMSVGMVAIMVVMTLPAIAEYAVPGDVLYPVKVRINEEVRSTLARTPYEKVEWESKRIERRISEARILAKAGLLTPEAEDAVAEAVTQHRTNANVEIALLRQSNNIDEAALANMTLASVFEVHSTAFRVDMENNSNALAVATSSAQTHALASVLEGGRAELALLNETEVISYERLMAEIEKQTTRAYERLESIKKTALPQEVSDIKRRLEDISGRIILAKNRFQEGGNEDVSQLRGSLQDLQKLVAFMNDIDVRSTVAVEKIVPITLTFEERHAVLLPQIEQLTIEVKKIEQVVSTVSDSSVIEKVAFYLPEMKDYLNQVVTITPESITTAEKQLLIMQEMSRSLEALLSGVGGNFDIHLEVNESATSTATNTDESILDNEIAPEV